MSDQIVRAITSDGLVKASAITGTELVERARVGESTFQKELLRLPLGDLL